MTTNTRTEALAEARKLADDLGSFDVGFCLREIRKLYDVAAHDFTPGDGRSPDAAEAWRFAKRQHPQRDLRRIPAGVPVFWIGGAAGHGHIAMKAGGDGVDVWSTDFARPGHLDRVDGTLIGPRWGMQLVGWSEDLNGEPVYSQPAAKITNNVTDARKLIRKAVEQLREAPPSRKVVHDQADVLAGVLRRLPTT